MNVAFKINDGDLIRYEVMEAVAKCGCPSDLFFIHSYLKHTEKRQLTSEELQQRIKFLNTEIICEE